MTLVLELTPAEQTRLDKLAREAGLAPGDYLRGMIGAPPKSGSPPPVGGGRRGSSFGVLAHLRGEFPDPLTPEAIDDAIGEAVGEAREVGSAKDTFSEAR